MRPEPLQQRVVGIERRASDDGQVLQAHGVPIRLEVIHGIQELRVDVLAGARVGGLRVDDICATKSATASVSHKGYTC